MPALPAIDENARLDALRAHAFSDPGALEAFDRLTRIASQVFQAPIALVSVVEAKRQEFRSCHGLTTRHTPRGIAFCDWAILGREVMVVPDATLDHRFEENPLVVGEPHLRFYAGAPLMLPGGFCAGTLCILDQVPREFSAKDRALLADLAGAVVDAATSRLASTQATAANIAQQEETAARRHVEEALRQSEARQVAVLRASLDANIIIDQESHVLQVNPAFESIFAYRAEDVRAAGVPG